MAGYEGSDENTHIEYQSRRAPDFLLGKLVSDVMHITPDITVAEAIAGERPARLSEPVDVAEGRYVYCEPPPHAMGIGTVGLGELQIVVGGADELETMARYDLQMVASEQDVETVGGVEDMVVGVLANTDAVILRQCEWQLTYGGYGGTAHVQTVGVTYHALPNAENGDDQLQMLFGVHADNPEMAVLRVDDVADWQQLVSLKRLDRQVDPEADE